ncbi:Long-chain-fatty-acid--CoA ligase [Fulvivirga imtechensis AK7]|uniref:Long-chain-fatty-acid--CoA ligase n=1 Tax=Fulvivirga imtechensis AK7 TaxID=1237149 RepID=L8JN47_9BACT|nr:Long-chain-fatty-acid--CoA ligase [Fulvivirga imtechensis AK7]
MWISGAGLGRGYLHNEELTSEKFIPNPFKPGEKVYKTGDLARWLPDGNIEYLGRIDHQVKIRGFRIELGEIESHLTSHEAVREAVVACLEEPIDKKLVAFLVLRDNATFNLFEFKTFLRTRLPDYMTPPLIRKTDHIPLTPTGKVDRKTLLKSVAQTSIEASAGRQPKTEIEIELANIWSELLMNKNISIDNNFFELGGHSLILLKVNAIIKEKYSVELPFNLYFNHTLHQIAQLIEKTQVKSKKEDQYQLEVER